MRLLWEGGACTECASQRMNISAAQASSCQDSSAEVQNSCVSCKHPEFERFIPACNLQKFIEEFIVVDGPVQKYTRTGIWVRAGCPGCCRNGRAMRMTKPLKPGGLLCLRLLWLLSSFCLCFGVFGFFLRPSFSSRVKMCRHIGKDGLGETCV